MTQQPSLLPDLPTPDISSDKAARAQYQIRLGETLQDPSFRAIEGFPDRLGRGDPGALGPTLLHRLPQPLPARNHREVAGRTRRAARSNGAWRRHRGKRQPTRYHREPFSADVSEGKGDAIYSAHGYHTKVPHKAIMRYILHYTDPGDIVYDGFCGTGMTGVAAQLCGDRKAVQELGYRVDAAGVVYDGERPISRLGPRKAVLADLSPAATFIAYNYNTPVDVAAFRGRGRAHSARAGGRVRLDVRNVAPEL